MIGGTWTSLFAWAGLALCVGLTSPVAAKRICVEELSGVCLKFKDVPTAKPAPKRSAAKPPAPAAAPAPAAPSPSTPPPSMPAEPNAAACLRETGEDVSWDDLAANPMPGLASCQAAYRIKPAPDIAYRLGRVHDASGDLDAALPLYEEAAKAGSLPALSSLCESLAYDNLPGARAWCLKAAEAGIEGAAERAAALN